MKSKSDNENHGELAFFLAVIGAVFFGFGGLVLCTQAIEAWSPTIAACAMGSLVVAAVCIVVVKATALGNH